MIKGKIMEKNELSVPAFFGQQGLTAASANHIADIATRP